MIRKKKFGRCACAGLLAGLLTLMILMPAVFAKAPARVVRVAYPIQQGLTEVDENGNLKGYTYEYLQEIAQYTGWQYEFVQVPGPLDESLGTLMEMLRTGEVDLMGALSYSNELANIYDYTSHSYGTTETVLQVLYDDTHDIVINAQAMQSLRVATISSGSRIRREMDEYCAINLIDVEYVLCKDEAEMIEALRDGRADVLLNTSVNYLEDVRTIARFSPKPFYFAASRVGNEGLVAQLNAALSSIEQCDPSFSSTLFNKYFISSERSVPLTDTERGYIKNCGLLRVGVMEGQAPFQYWDEKTGQPKGISVELLRHIAQQTGLVFSFVPVQNYARLDQLTETGAIDLVAGSTYDYAFAQTHGFSLTRPFVSAQYIVLLNDNVSDSNLNGKRLALSRQSVYSGALAGEVTYYESNEACIQAVNSGEADYTYVDAYTAQYYINHPDYRHFSLIPQTYKPREVCLGVMRVGDIHLLTILNKQITSVPLETLQSIIYRNTIYRPEVSLLRTMQDRPWESLMLISSFLLCIILLLLLLVRQRNRLNRRMSLDLKKHMQVYALANDYFLEYTYETDSLLIYAPVKGNAFPKVLHYSSTPKPGEAAHITQDRDIFFDLIRSCADGTQEVNIPCPDGRRKWIRVVVKTIYDRSRPVYTIGKITDIDHEKKEKEQLERRARLDSLTHLLNAESGRLAVTEALSQIGDGAYGGLIIFDIDYFKSINDTYGHMFGDKVLCATAEILRANFRSDDIICRPGGDEFSVYMRHVQNESALRDKCGAVCRKLGEYHLEETKCLSVSMGAALTIAGDQYADVFQRADKALYTSKALGRGQFYIAPRGETNLENKGTNA